MGHSHISVEGFIQLPLVTMRASVVRRFSTKITPLSDRVLVAKIKAPEKTVGGIVLPESAQPKINKATVVAVGEGRKNLDGKLVPMTVRVGDTVLLSESYNGTEVSFEGKDLVLYREDDILAVLKD